MPNGVTLEAVRVDSTDSSFIDVGKTRFMSVYYNNFAETCAS